MDWHLNKQTAETLHIKSLIGNSFKFIYLIKNFKLLSLIGL